MPPQPYIAKWAHCIVRVLHETSIMLIPVDWEYSGTTTPTTAQLLVLIQNFWNAVGPQWAAMCGNSYTILDIQVTDRAIPGGAFASFVPVTANVGLKTSDTMPSNVALVVSKRTGQAGRRNRGRMYTFGWVDGDAAGSVFNSTAVNQATAFVSAIAAYHNTGNVPTVNWSIVSIADLQTKPITAIAVDSIADSQRRRLPGRGF